MEPPPKNSPPNDGASPQKLPSKRWSLYPKTPLQTISPPPKNDLAHPQKLHPQKLHPLPTIAPHPNQRSRLPSRTNDRAPPQKLPSQRSRLPSRTNDRASPQKLPKKRWSLSPKTPQKTMEPLPKNSIPKNDGASTQKRPKKRSCPILTNDRAPHPPTNDRASPIPQPTIRLGAD